MATITLTTQSRTTSTVNPTTPAAPHSVRRFLTALVRALGAFAV
jgi:hypothetical protein